MNAGRYYGLGMYTASTLQPTNATTLRYAWRDLNGDKSVQRNELDIAKGFLTTPTSNYDPANPSAAVTPAIVDPNLRNDKTDELILGFDHELMANFGVGVSYIYRKYSRPARHLSHPGLHRGVRAGDVHARRAATRRPAAPRHTAGVYYQRPTTLHAQTILRNDTKYNTYNGVEFTARKRLANKWMMNGSLVWNHQLHFEPDANIDYLDPTNHAPIDLINGYESGGMTLSNSAGADRDDQHQRPQRAGHRQAVRPLSVPVGHQLRGELQRALQLPVQPVHPDRQPHRRPGGRGDLPQPQQRAAISGAVPDRHPRRQDAGVRIQSAHLTELRLVQHAEQQRRADAGRATESVDGRQHHHHAGAARGAVRR